jgi:hypothetical protein
MRCRTGDGVVEMPIVSEVLGRLTAALFVVEGMK